jgi:Trypsin-co-occurring domain 1
MTTSRPVQVQLPTGEVIWAKVAVDGPQNVASGTLQHLDIDELGRTIRGLSASLYQAVDRLMPDEVEVEFGLELALKSGKLISMLAEAGGTASVKVTLGWKAEKTEITSAAETAEKTETAVTAQTGET